MSGIGKIIQLDESTRKLYSKYDFKYFLDIHFRKHRYSEADINNMHSTYAVTKTELEKEIKVNKRQALFHIDGMIRKCHSGGFLPSLFNLDESRGSGGFLDFQEIGRTWAYFDVWARAERWAIFWRKFWDVVVKTGSVLGFILSIIKIIEVLQPVK